MPLYLYDQQDWPYFRWDSDSILVLLSRVRHKQGMLTGRMKEIGFQLQNEAYLESLSQDVLKSSEIEGEMLNPEQVRSSIARQLGIYIGGLVESEKHVEGIVQMMVDATQNWQKELNANRLFDWHAALFPTGRSGMYKIIVGDWRNDSTGPMQVVSGALGKEKVHFEGPVALRLNEEMDHFFAWINTSNNRDPILNAAIAHLWFLTVHPFEDGNGRIARAITDMLLCRSEFQSHRFYSLSKQIQVEKKGYYEILEKSQKGNMDITAWLIWFLNSMEKAIDSSTEIVKKIMNKHLFWQKHQAVPFNERQIKVINLLFSSFYGKLSTSKWAKINKCSTDTALRDIQDLVKKKVLIKSDASGRSTNYNLNIE